MGRWREGGRGTEKSRDVLERDLSRNGEHLFRSGQKGLSLFGYRLRNERREESQVKRCGDVKEAKGTDKVAQIS